MRGSALDAAHFAEADLEAGLGELPGGLGPGETAADDVDVVHGASHSEAASSAPRIPGDVPPNPLTAAALLGAA